MDMAPFIRSTAEEHSLWLETNGEKGKRARFGGKFSYCDFSGLDLRMANFNGSYLTGSNLSNCKLVGATFVDTFAYGTNFDKSDMRRVDLSATLLDRATLRGVNLNGANFNTCVAAKETDFTGSYLVSAKLVKNAIFNAATPATFTKITIDYLTSLELPDFIRNLYESTFIVMELEDLSSGPNTIIREINFEPEHKAAGIAILSYFGTIVEDKYKNSDVSVKIEQQGNNVKLSVNAPSGEMKLLIVEDLAKFSDTVSGKLRPIDFLGNQAQAQNMQNFLSACLPMLNLSMPSIEGPAALNISGLKRDLNAPSTGNITINVSPSIQSSSYATNEINLNLGRIISSSLSAVEELNHENTDTDSRKRLEELREMLHELHSKGAPADKVEAANNWQKIIGYLTFASSLMDRIKTLATTSTASITACSELITNLKGLSDWLKSMF